MLTTYENYSAKLRRPAIALSALLSLLQAAPAAAQPVCKPALTVSDIVFSNPVNLKRFWTATVHVDASRCASSSGLFALGFLRLAESGPDLEFSEAYFWKPGANRVWLELWADEAVEKYWIADIPACPCRAD